MKDLYDKALALLYVHQNCKKAFLAHFFFVDLLTKKKKKISIITLPTISQKQKKQDSPQVRHSNHNELPNSPKEQKHRVHSNRIMNWQRFALVRLYFFRELHS